MHLSRWWVSNVHLLRVTILAPTRGRWMSRSGQANYKKRCLFSTLILDIPNTQSPWAYLPLQRVLAVGITDFNSTCHWREGPKPITKRTFVVGIDLLWSITIVDCVDPCRLKVKRRFCHRSWPSTRHHQRRWGWQVMFLINRWRRTTKRLRRCSLMRPTMRSL